jgi:tetratricopeptide (TPR) repeat protein
MVRALAMVIAVFAMAQLHAQSFDSLSARLKDLPIDTLIAREKATDDPRMKVALLARVVQNYLFLNRGDDCLSTSIRMLGIAEPTGNDTLIARAHLSLGFSFAIANEVNAALKHYNIALDRYAGARDSIWMGATCKELAVLYQRVGDNDGAMRYMRKAMAYGMPPGIRSRGLATVARYFMDRGELDSALHYTKQVEMPGSPGEDPWTYTYSNGALAAVYAARHEADLAELHYKRAIAAADSFHLPAPLVQYSAGYSSLLLEQGRRAEAQAIAQLGYRSTAGVRNPSIVEKAAQALADAFKADGMADSAFYYAKLCIAYRDSVIATQSRSQLQSQLFAQQLKDMEDAKLRAEEVATRSRNIQFGIIALIVITLGIFLLVFSRTAVVGAKAIKNLSLIALLLFFEFINLLLHPFLGELTHHSPLLMLLCMAAIAGLLIPLHHRMEKLITNMLVSKNNRVRLEAARRTIEELEGAGKSEPAS